MKGNNPGMTASQLLKILAANRLNFYDEFSRPVVDTDIWTQAGDGGTWTFPISLGAPAYGRLRTGNVIDNDEYLNGDVKNNKRYSPNENGYSTVTLNTRVRLSSIADVSAIIGTYNAAMTAYTLPAGDCILFYADNVSGTWMVRTYRAAQEVTDTLVALDTAWHILTMIWTATSVRFYIDGVLVATHATQVPSYQQTMSFLIRTEAAATKDLDIDYLHVEYS